MRTKRLFAFVVVIAMVVFCFAGCGGGGNDKSEQTILIGGIGPTTGGAAIYGNAVKNGAELAIEEINAAGGVNGIKLEMNFQDDEHDVEKSVNAYNTLKDKGVKIIMGAVTSDPCVAVAAETYADNIFQITPSGSSVDCVKYDNAFRVCFSDPNQGLASAQYIKQNNLATKVAVIYDSSSIYSAGIYETFNAEAKKSSLEVVEALAFTNDSKTDFSVQLQKVQESGAELVFLPIYYQEAALILQQAKKINLNVKFFGCDGLDGLIDVLGDDIALAEDVMLLTPFAADATDEKTVAFVKAYREKYNNETPNQFAADAYDAIYTIAEAMKAADIKDASISASDLCEQLKAAMTKITLAGVTGTITWSADGEPTKDPKAVKITLVEKEVDGQKVLTGTYTAM